MRNLLKVLNRKIIVFILFLSMLFSLQGCMQYYKVKKVSNISDKEIVQFISQKKFIIIHQDNEARYLSNAGIEGSMITGELVNLRDDQLKYKSTKPKGATRYRNNMKYKEKYVTNEVHLYLQNSVVKDFGSAKQVMIPLSDIAYTDVYSKARGKTIFSWVYPGLIYSGVSYAIILILANALGNSFNLDIM